MALTQVLPGMLAPASVLLENFSASGSPSSTTFLRGDNTWAVISTADVSTVTNQKLFTTSSVTFASINATTATFTNINFNTATTQVGLATSIVGNGSGNGALLYQESPNTTKFLGQGAAGWLLVSYDSGQPPRFTSTGSIYVKSSVNTENLRGGSDYSIPYQRVAFGTATTNYISSSTTASTYLSWTGSGYAWLSTTDLDFRVATDPQG